MPGIRPRKLAPRPLPQDNYATRALQKVYLGRMQDGTLALCTHGWLVMRVSETHGLMTEPALAQYCARLGFELVPNPHGPAQPGGRDFGQDERFALVC